MIIAPTCWFGSPHDFWWLAPTALTATATACVAIMVRFANPSKEDHCQANSHSLYFEFSMTSAPITTIPRESIDSHDSGSCYTNTTTSDPPLEFDPVFPPPEDFNGFGEGDTNHICTFVPAILFFSLLPHHVCLCRICELSNLPGISPSSNPNPNVSYIVVRHEG